MLLQDLENLMQRRLRLNSHFNRNLKTNSKIKSEKILVFEKIKFPKISPKKFPKRSLQIISLTVNVMKGKKLKLLSLLGKEKSQCINFTSY